MTIPNPEAEVSPAESAGAPSRPWRRTWWAITVSVLLVLSVLGILIGCDADDPRTGSDDSSVDGATESPEPEATLDPVPQEVEQEPPGLGEEARDGDFTFVVTGVEDGPADFGTEPDGRFVVVTATVTNRGDEPRSLRGDDQILIDARGGRTPADVEAAVYLDDTRSLLEQINPGDSLTGVVVFDIAVDTLPAGVELHESASSDGVTVALG